MTTERVAIVTAGGSGMGALRRELAALGYRLAVMSSSGKGEALGRELGGLGFTGSNTDPALLERVVAATLDRYGRIDAVGQQRRPPAEGRAAGDRRRRLAQGLDMILLPVRAHGAPRRAGHGAAGRRRHREHLDLCRLRARRRLPVSCVLRAGPRQLLQALRRRVTGRETSA